MRLIGPIRPPLAREGESETSAASFSKLSPAAARARIASARAFGGLVGGDVHAPRFGRRADEDLAQRDGGRRREFRQVRVVIGARLVVGHRDLVHDFVLLDALPDHLAFQVLPEIGHRQPFLFEGGLELFLGLELVLSSDVVEHALELRVAQGVAELLAALHDEHLVDRVHEDLRRDFVERLPELVVVRVALEVDLLALQLAQPGDLALLEVRLREDLAVHLHENLLDDFGARATARENQDERETQEQGF